MNAVIVPVLKIAKLVAQILLLVVSLFWFAFALLSGAEEAGGGFIGLVRNSPNALPWLLLLAFNWLAHKFNLAGGLILFAFSWFAFFLFDMYEAESLPILFLIFLPVLTVSLIFIANGILDRRLAAGESGNGGAGAHA